MKLRHAIPFLLFFAPLLAPAAQRLDLKPLPGNRMTGRIKFETLAADTAKVELGAEKAEAARLDVGPKLRSLNARRGTVEQRTQSIRALKKKKATLDINDD